MTAHATNTIPPMGLGTWGRRGREGEEAILAAIGLGYRHLDTAQSYGTEESVGPAVERSGLTREAVFVTTKIAQANLTRDRLRPSLRESLDRLRMDRVDLTLIHWPSPGDEVPLAEYLEELARAKSEGLTRLIGVSNFTIALLEKAEAILGPGAIACNQVEVHPFLQNRALRAYCASQGITVTAYSPLAKGKVAEDPVLIRIAERHGVIASQAGLAYLLQRGLVVIPASGDPGRLRSNFEAQNVRLSQDELKAIDALDRGERLIAPANGPAWD